MALPATKNSAGSLRHLLNTIEYHSRCVKALGEIPDAYANAARAQKVKILPTELTTLWRRNHTGGILTFNQLMGELTTEVQALEQEEMTRKQVKESAQTQSLYVNTGGKGKQTRIKRERQPCFYCESTEHHFHECTEGNITDRKSKARKDKRCLKCLGKGHSTTECKAEWKCKHCKNKDHSPSLCHAKYGTEKAVSFVPSTKKAGALLTVTDKPRNLSGEASNVLALTCQSDEAVLLQTVTVLITSKNGKKHRALGLIDSGSHRSFIRANLAQKLKWDATGTEELLVSGFGTPARESTVFPVYTLPLQGTYAKAEPI